MLLERRNHRQREATVSWRNHPSTALVGSVETNIRLVHGADLGGLAWRKLGQLDYFVMKPYWTRKKYVGTSTSDLFGPKGEKS